MTIIGNSPITATTRSGEIGATFLAALAARDFVTLASCFAEEARFRALLPSGLQEAAGSNGPTRWFQQWFGTVDSLELVESRCEAIADRHHLSWRFRADRDAQWHVIEQQAFATIRDGRFVRLDLVCSGFRPEEAPVGSTPHVAESVRPSAAAVLEGGNADCATLTPLIKAKLGELASGQVLEVITSEPTAERDITSWSSLTGNELVGTRGNGAEQHFYVRKKS